MEKKLSYKIISDNGKELLLSTYYDGNYIGKSKGYYKAGNRIRIEIYPYQIIYPVPNVNLRTYCFYNELTWEKT